MSDFVRGLGILIGIALVLGLACRVVAFAWGLVAVVWEFLVVKGFMILLALVAGVVVLAALVAVIAFIGRISRGK